MIIGWGAFLRVGSIVLPGVKVGSEPWLGGCGRRARCARAQSMSNRNQAVATLEAFHRFEPSRFDDGVDCRGAVVEYRDAWFPVERSGDRYAVALHRRCGRRSRRRFGKAENELIELSVLDRLEDCVLMDLASNPRWAAASAAS